MTLWTGAEVDELIAALARERRDFEALLFRILGARHVLEARSHRFLSWVASDIDRAAELLRESELRRASVAAATAARQGGDLTLRELLEGMPEPHRSVLADHRLAIGRLAAETAAAAEAAHERAERQRALVSARLVEPRNDGEDDYESLLALELALCGYDAVIAATRPLLLPALSTFLS